MQTVHRGPGYGLRRPLARYVEPVALAACLGLAAFLRLGWPGVNSFGYDEARVSLLALQMARQGQFARVGIPSSAGVPNFPAAIWLMALPYALSTDPLVATLFVGLLSALAVLGAWWLARRAWGPWAALAAAALLATSPFAVLYSRAIWGQDLLGPLAVLWAIAGVLAVAADNPWALGLHVFLAGFTPQVHYAGFTLAPATLWLLLRYRLWRRWPAILGGAALAAIAAAPFLYTLWQGADGLRTAFQQLARQPVQVDLKALRQLAQMGAGANWEWLPLGPSWQWPQGWRWLLTAARLAAGALILLGLARLLLWLVRDLKGGRRDWGGALTALVPAWALSSLIVFTRHSTPVYQQYHLAVLPALFLAAGALAERRSSRPLRTAALGIALAVALVQAFPLVQSLNVVAERLAPGGLGTPLQWPARAARSLMDGRPVMVYTVGADPAFNGDAAGFDVLLWGYPHRVIDGRSALIIPAHPAHLLAVFPDLPVLDEAQACGLVRDETLFPRRQGEPPFPALLVGGSEPQGFQTITPVRLANGATLVGWRLQTLADGRLRLSTWWQLAGPVIPGDYHQFNHLRVQLDGEPLAVQDVLTSSQAWQEGDNLITWADFDSPPAGSPFWLDVGMYTWPDLKRVPILGATGDPVAPIRLGPVTGNTPSGPLHLP